MMGMNTLDTYVAWNLHEPKEGEFEFAGWLDVVEYVKMAGEEGLKVIIRPGLSCVFVPGCPEGGREGGREGLKGVEGGRE